jgi:hypothetical protein
MVTVAKAGALSTPRLSVTTSENVTVPEVLGTVTKTLEVGAVVVTVGLAGESGVETRIGMGIGIGLITGLIGLMMGTASASGRFSLVLSDGAICFSLLVRFFAVTAAPTSTDMR